MNDDSIDNTLKILKEYEKKMNERIKDQGMERNIGMKNLKGEYLMFLDSDDIYEYIMVEELFAKIKGNNAEIIFVIQ